jgi:hypothetical protein
MEKLFQLLAVVLAGIAAYFLWSGSSDAAFVTAVLGAVSFFLGVRFQLKERTRLREAQDAQNEEPVIEENTEEDSQAAGQ